MKLKNIFAFLLVSGLLLTLAACKPILDVKLMSPDEHLPSPRFLVEDLSRPGQRPLYDTIKVADAGGDLYWHLRAEPFGDQNSVAQFAYADTLSGFAAIVPAKPLQAGHDYTLSVIGQGLGSLRFRVDSAGAVHIIR
jgi:hypothetical protein